MKWKILSQKKLVKINFHEIIFPGEKNKIKLQYFSCSDGYNFLKSKYTLFFFLIRPALTIFENFFVHFVIRQNVTRWGLYKKYPVDFLPHQVLVSLGFCNIASNILVWYSNVRNIRCCCFYCCCSSKYFTAISKFSILRVYFQYLVDVNSKLLKKSELLFFQTWFPYHCRHCYKIRRLFIVLVNNTIKKHWSKNDEWRRWETWINNTDIYSLNHRTHMLNRQQSR